jgi:hypothetical protein
LLGTIAQACATQCARSSRERCPWGSDAWTELLVVTDEKSLLRSLRRVADDFQAWRAQVRRLLQAQSDWQIVVEASDGLEAIMKKGRLATPREVLPEKSWVQG